MPTVLKIRALRTAQKPRRAFTKQRARLAVTSTVKQGGRFAFTLLELLVVTGIIAILMVLLAPAFTTLKSAGDVTNAAYTIKGVIEQARTYAKANNTYTWVGFYEETVSTPSTNPATPGVGRVVMSVVASKDGTTIYTGGLTSPAVELDPTKLIQVGKLTKIDNIHLKTFPDPVATPPPESFERRPAPGLNTARIGDTSPDNPSLSPFRYPVGSPPPTAQYTFSKAVQFSPLGEARIDNNNYSLKAVIEIGFQSTHGITPEPSPVKNPVAVQLTGFGGNVKIYRR
jgi:prepilin-type N-terminal cleavage/methylation domain-containing protein